MYALCDGADMASLVFAVVIEIEGQGDEGVRVTR